MHSAWKLLFGDTVALIDRLPSRTVLLISTAALALAGGSAVAQQRPAVTGVAFVRITTANETSSRQFYEQTMGFQSTPLRAGLLRYDVDALQWFEVEEVVAAPVNGRLAAVGFTTRDLSAMQRYLKSKGIAAEGPPQDGRMALRDPEGNLLYFVQEHPAAKLPVQARAPSQRMIHAGFVVRDRAREDSFYRDVLGFHLYWEGGMKAGDPDWVNMQVPEGTDCLEYMLHQAASPGAKQLGIMNHFAFGVKSIHQAEETTLRNGCAPGAVCEQPHMGREGKMGMNLYDPDGTRVELMEFVPTGEDFGSPFGGRHPTEEETR